MSARAALVIAPALIQWIVRGGRDVGVELPSLCWPNRLRLLGLIGLVVVGFAFRATRLSESLWYDESRILADVRRRRQRAGGVIGNFRDPINHVFHTLLNFWSVKYLDASLDLELAFRLPALLFSLFSIVAMHELGKVAGGERVGFIAAAPTAVFPCRSWKAAKRGYSMMIFFSALMSWLMICARNRRQCWVWMLYSAACALGIWSHFVTVFVPIGHAVWLMWCAVRCREWREFSAGFVALTLGAVLTITLYSPMIPQMLHVCGMFAAVNPDQPRILSAEGFHALLQLGGSWYWWAAIPGLDPGADWIRFNCSITRSRKRQRCGRIGAAGVAADAADRHAQRLVGVCAVHILCAAGRDSWSWRLDSTGCGHSGDRSWPLSRDRSY